MNPKRTRMGQTGKRRETEETEEKETPPREVGRGDPLLFSRHEKPQQSYYNSDARTNAKRSCATDLIEDGAPDETAKEEGEYGEDFVVARDLELGTE